jgi:hypothetical protein
MTDALAQAARNTSPLRFSQLRRMAQSPAHYLAAPEPSSSAIDIGNAADALILGSAEPVTFYPGSVRRGKEWESFAAAHAHSIILTKREHAIAEGMAEAVRRCPHATQVLDGLIRETRYWTVQGRSCRGTPDVHGVNFLTDLKTGETSDPRRFPWKVRQFAYHAQLAWYRAGVIACGLPVPEDCYIVAVEQTPPHVVTVFRLTPQTLDLGERLCRLWFEQLKVCEESGVYPGYSQSIVDLDLLDDETLIELAAATDPSPAGA